MEKSLWQNRNYLLLFSAQIISLLGSGVTTVGLALFAYQLTGGGELSNHAYGRAIDINTVQNPYVKGKLILPPNGNYNPNAAGTFTANSPIVKMFIALGWDWGGSWTRLQDYQHFEKPLKNDKKQ